MSELPLPVDPDDWPENAFELLGAPMGSDAKTLKRAYQKLIRVYRPEHYPDEFRRIREAYESAQAITGWIGSVGEFGDVVIEQVTPEMAPAETASSEPAEVERPTEPEPTQAEPTAEEPSRPVDDDPEDRPYKQRLAEAWSPAVQGDAATAYRALAVLRRTHPRRVESYLALYWLLRMNPKLELERQPADWLAECLSDAEDRGSALELYRRELVRHPAEALSARCAALLRSPLGKEAITSLAEWRWRVAIRREECSVVRDDLDALRRSRFSYDGDAWTRILWTAVETCCWSASKEARELTTECMTELERHANGPESNYDALNQLDYVLEAASYVTRLKGEAETAEFRRLIARSWSSSPSDLYVLLCRMVEPWLERPDGLLNLLSDVGENGAAALGRFGQVLQLIEGELERNAETFWTTATARSVVVDFLEVTSIASGYDHGLRLLLLELCLHERLPPDVIAQVLLDRTIFSSGHGRLAERIAQDWPLQFTYRTMCLMSP